MSEPLIISIENTNSKEKKIIELGGQSVEGVIVTDIKGYFAKSKRKVGLIRIYLVKHPFRIQIRNQQRQFFDNLNFYIFSPGKSPLELDFTIPAGQRQDDVSQWAYSENAATNPFEIGGLSNSVLQLTLGPFTKVEIEFYEFKADKD